MNDRYLFRGRDREGFEYEWSALDMKPLHTDDMIVIEQCTGLKDKNGVELLFEGDILSIDGLKKGNIHGKEIHKTRFDIVIPVIGSENWLQTYKAIMGRIKAHS